MYFLKGQNDQKKCAKFFLQLFLFSLADVAAIKGCDTQAALLTLAGRYFEKRRLGEPCSFFMD